MIKYMNKTGGVDWFVAAMLGIFSVALIAAAMVLLECSVGR